MSESLPRYKHAGFRLVGKTKGGLLAWQLLPADMPDPLAALGSTEPLALDGAA